ncbi:MAG: hypothetical protein II552_02545, partial [Bacteroidales bacterium]|nr:hypothetical protein [Bacteroidales bacterium]
LEQLAGQAEGGKAAEIGTGEQTASGTSASVDNGSEKCTFQTLGLDGYHHTAAYLKSTKGMYSWECAPHEVLLQSVKGAPESYDTALFAEKLRAVRNADGAPVFWPVYDRQLHDVVPDRIPVTGDILLIEGNWLLLNESPWKEITEECADETIFIRAEEEQLRDRLIHRKVMGGKTEAEGYRDIFRQMTEKFGFKYTAATLRESFSASHNGWKALIYDGKEFYESKRYDIDPIVDRVGGGDSFSGGLIHGLLTMPSMKDALEFTVAASALKHTIPGDVNLVSEAEVQSLAAGNASGRIIR